MSTQYQNYISVSEEQTFHDNVRSVIGASRHPRQGPKETILSSIGEDSPYVLIIDGRTPETITLVQRLRSQHPLANIPLIIILPAQHSLKKELSLYKNISVLSEADLETELATYVEIAIDEQFIDRAPDQTHSYTMEYCADLWREGGSATVLLESGRSFSIHRGGVLSLRDIPKLKKLLYAAPPKSQELHHPQHGDWISVGALLWSETKKYCHPGFLKYRKWLHFQPGEYSFRALELPISLPTRKLLFSTDANKPLVQRIRTLGLNIPQVEEDIEALYLLGLYSFETTSIEQFSSRTTTEVLSQSTLLPKQDWEQWLKEALLEQWRKRDDPNPWTALGFLPKKDLSEQLEKRRENLRIFECLSSPEMQRKYQQVKDQLDSATTTLAFSKHLYEIYGYPDSSEDEALYFQALALLKAKRSSDAAQMLASLPTTNPIYRALLGWTLSRDEDADLKTAFEHIAYALRGDQTSVYFETIACIVLMQLEQWNMAQKRLRFLVDRYNTEQIRSLLWFCQREQTPSTWWLSLP